MSRPADTRLIRGVTYETITLGGREGTAVVLRLAKLYGPAMRGGDAQEMVSALLANVNEADFNFVVDALARSTFVCDGGKKTLLFDSYDAHFAGRLGAMAEWLAWAVGFNFQDFFSELRSL